MSSTQHNSFFPFEAFIDKLRENGFPVGVHTYIHVQTLVNELDPDTSQETLKYLLAPLFVKNEREQIKFYRLFDNYCRLVEEVERKALGQIKESEPIPKKKKKKRTPRKGLKVNRWWFMGGSVVISVLITCFVFGASIFLRDIFKEGVTHTYFEKYHLEDDGRYFYHLFSYAKRNLLGQPQICDDLKNVNFSYTEEFLDDGRIMVQFEDTATIGPDIYRLWDFGNGYVLADSISPKVFFPDTGIYEVSLTAINAYGCETNTRQLVNLRTPQTCFASFEAIITAENDRMVMFNDTSKAAANDPIVDWNWSFGDDDQTTTKGINPVFTYQTYREYKVCLTITTESNCKDTYCKVIRLKDPRKASELLNLSPQPPVHISIDSLRTSRLAPLWPLIRLSIALLLLFLLIFYELYKRNKKQLALSRETSKNGPYNWPLQFPHQAEIYPDEVFHKVATHLRQRQFSEILELDMDRTIESTLNSGGFPSFEYSFGTRPSEYLVLIERSNFKDHQARLYELLAEKLASQDIFIEVYYYQSDFRMYWKDLTERPIYLKELKVRHPNHRLIILGDGEHLLDPVYGDLNYDAFEFLEWKDRAVLTPIPPSEWSLQEVNLAKNFYVLPSTTKSLSTILDYFHSGENQRIGTWVKNGPYHPPLPDFDDDYDFDFEELKVYLGPDAYQWVAACAVYPELHWDMTLHLGEVLRQYSFASAPLVNEPNLLKIIRIPWFRTGIIPEEIREKLVDELSPEITRKIREEIHKILEANEPPPDSYAAEKRERQLTIQNWQLQPLSWMQKIQVGEKIEDMMDREEINDVTVLKYLKSQDDQRMTIPVPESWKEAIYKKGMPVLGLRSWVRWAVLLPIILLLLRPAIDFARKGHFQSIQDLKQLIKKPDNFVEIDGVYYKLDEATDSALYFAYLGNYSYWQGDFGPAYNRYTEAIQLNRFEPDYYYQRGLANYHLTRLAKVDSILLDTYKDFVRSVNLRPLFTAETKRRRDTIINLPVGNTGGISYDGQMILVSEGSSAKIYSRDSLKLLSSIPLGGVPRAMNWSKDGKYILSAVGNNGQIHEVQTGQKTARFEAHNYPINSIRFSPNGKYVITGAEDNLAIIWNRERGESKRPIHYLEHIHSGSILDVAFSPDNRFVATASADSTAGIWNSSTGQLEGYLLNHGFPVISVAFSPDSRSIMTASANGKIALWDLNGTKQFEKHILGETLSQVSFSADGSILMTLGERSDHSSKTIGFYSFRYERPMVKIDVSEFQTYDDQPAFVSLSGDGNYLLLGVEDIGIMTYNFDPLTFESDLIRKYGQFNQSVINYERELFADAISDFSKLIKQDGQNLDAYYGRGLSYLYQAQTSSESLDTISFRLGIEDLKYIMSQKNNYFDSLPELLPFFFQFFSDYEGLEKYADDLCLITKMIDAGYCELFKYEQILPYSDGLAAVKNDELWGYIDSSRSLVIPFQYEEAYPFKNGLAKVKARVRKTSSQFQLINSRNEVVYVDVGNPAEGLQYVRSPRNGLFGYIDVETGEEIIKPVYETAEDFERGYAIVSVREQKELHYGLIDRNGSAGRYGGFIYSKIIGQFGRDNKISVVSVGGKSYELDYISPFGDQKAVEFTGDIEDFQEKRNLPNQSNLPYEIVGDLSNGLIRAQQGGKFGFVAQVKQMNPYVQQTQSSKVEAGLRNPEEQYVVIIPFQYTEAYDFSYERAGVKNADGIWGFIDTYGKVVIPYRYDHVDYFIKREDKILAQVEENKQSYYIDRAGNCISFGELTCPTPEMRTYSKNTKRKTYTDQETNLQVFEENGKWGLRDQDGKIIVIPKFDNQINFSENLARVSKDGKWGFIDRTGKEVIGFDFEGALDFSDGLAAVRQGSRWGYIDSNGKVQINFLFSAPGRFQNGWAIIKEGKVSFKIDKKGNKIGSRRN